MTDDLLFQEFAGKVNATLDGSKGFGEHVGDLIVFIAIKIQQKRRFKDFWQVFDRCLDLFHVDVVLRLVGHGSRTVQQVFVGRVIENRALLGLATIVIDENVAHDGKQPGLDVGAHVVFLPIGKRFVECFLVEVVRRLAIPC